MLEGSHLKKRKLSDLPTFIFWVSWMYTLASFPTLTSKVPSGLKSKLQISLFFSEISIASLSFVSSCNWKIHGIFVRDRHQRAWGKMTTHRGWSQDIWHCSRRRPVWPRIRRRRRSSCCSSDDISAPAPPIYTKFQWFVEWASPLRYRICEST